MERSDIYRPQRSCSKVMILHLYVILLTGGVWHTPPLVDTLSTPRQRPPMGRHPPVQETATAADGKHPTGLHSCFFHRLLTMVLDVFEESCLLPVSWFCGILQCGRNHCDRSTIHTRGRWRLEHGGPLCY